jgi:Cu(I)/Ag(I) efflux system membrane fusion protein
MKRTNLFFIATPFAALLLASCGGPAPEGSAVSNSGAMPSMQQRTEGGAEHVAEGTLNSADPATGMVNISHGPVASASWPAMTMSFKLADPNAAADLTPGQRVEFHFTIESGMSATVTEISAAE